MTQIEIDIEDLAKAKSKKRVWVKPTATKKGHYREMEVGSSEEEMKWRAGNRATHAMWLRHQKRESQKPEHSLEYKDPAEKHLDELRVEEIKKLGLKQGDKVQLKSQFGSKVVAFSDKVDPLTIEKKVV